MIYIVRKELKFNIHYHYHINPLELEESTATYFYTKK
jgi:hypothetical protein